MPGPLLSTKLHIPAVSPRFVARPRLSAKLDQVLTRPLTLVSAPPGFGKTTCVAAWLRQQSVPVAWYALDAGDNDPARFVRYLVAALEKVQADAGRQVLGRLRSRRRSELGSLVTLLANEVPTWPGDFVLVLDDYHLIEQHVIHEALAGWLDRLPPPMHLVIATRADPPFPLARMRSRDQLVELRASDLRFAPEEAATFLTDRMGLSLTPEQNAALDERAEGWIAALQLAALSMQGLSDVDGFVKAFAGSHHFMLDYLAEEVLQRQTAEIQTFLLQTCILDQMNAALVDAVTGRTDGARILAQLDKANLFVVPLDDARQWYRYHHLFDDFLDSRLEAFYSAQIGDLHRKACAWFAQNGMLAEAVDHAMAVPDYDRAAQLIEQAGLVLLMRSEVVTLLNWIARLPDDLLQARPVLRLLQAGALTGVGQVDLALARLSQIDDSALDPQARAMAALLRMAIPLFRADAPDAIESARQALEAALDSSMEQGRRQTEFDTVVIAYLTVILAELQFVGGQLRAAVATCRRGLDVVSSLAVPGPWAPIVGIMHISLAELFYEWNDIDAAERHAARGLDISRAGRNEELESYALVALAMVKRLRGEPGSALALCQQAIRLGRKRNVDSELSYMANRVVRVLVSEERIDEAVQLVSALPPEDEIVLFIEQGFAWTARARVLIARHEFDHVVPALEAIRVKAQSGGHIGTLVETLALLSSAQYAQGSIVQARETLMSALSVAEPERYVRTFVDLGEPMRLQIAECRRRIENEPDRRHLVQYMDRLLAAFPARPPKPNGNSCATLTLPPKMIEPLSERELVVLRLVAEGLTNQEIADRLIIAVSTVKTHVNHVFDKLDVRNRVQALERAREHKLL